MHSPRTPLRTARRPKWRVIVGMGHADRRNRLSEALRDSGCRVTAAGDGMRLVKLLSLAILSEDPSERPALIIADLTMSGCLGMGILEGIRQLNWDTPFFAIVDFNSEDTAHRAFRLGADRVFEKPIDVEDVRAAAITLLLSKHGPDAPRVARRRPALHIG